MKLETIGLYLLWITTILLFVWTVGTGIMKWYTSNTDEGRIMYLRDVSQGKHYEYEWFPRLIWFLLAFAILAGMEGWITYV